MRQDEGYKVKKAPITAPWFLAPYHLTAEMLIVLLCVRITV